MNTKGLRVHWKIQVILKNICGNDLITSHKPCCDVTTRSCAYWLNMVAQFIQSDNVETSLFCVVIKINTKSLNVIQSTLVISTSVISNNRLSRRENLIPVST